MRQKVEFKAIVDANTSHLIHRLVRLICYMYMYYVELLIKAFHPYNMKNTCSDIIMVILVYPFRYTQHAIIRINIV